MNKILRYKKSIISLIVLILMLVCGLSLLAFQDSIIKVDYDNPSFCYNIEELASSENPLDYPNVETLISYNEKEFDGVVIVSGDEVYEVNGNYLYDIMPIGIVKGGDTSNTSVEILATTNSLSDKRSEFMPKITFANNLGTLTINIAKQKFNCISNDDDMNLLVIKLLIRIK